MADNVSTCVTESADTSREIAGNVVRLDQSAKVTAEEAERTHDAGSEIRELATDVHQLVSIFDTGET